MWVVVEAYHPPRWYSGKLPTCQCRRCRFNPWVRKIPGRRKWQPTPVFLPGKSRGHWSLVGYCHGVSYSLTWLSTHSKSLDDSSFELWRSWARVEICEGLSSRKGRKCFTRDWKTVYGSDVWSTDCTLEQCSRAFVKETFNSWVLLGTRSSMTWFTRKNLHDIQTKEGKKKANGPRNCVMNTLPTWIWSTAKSASKALLTGSNFRVTWICLCFSAIFSFRNRIFSSRTCSSISPLSFIFSWIFIFS